MSDYHRLDKSNRYLVLSGAPLTVVSSRTREQFGYRAIINPNLGVTISPQDQELIYQQLTSGQVALGDPCLILIGAENIVFAQKMAANIAATYIENTTNPFPFVKWFNLGYHDFEFMREHTPQLGVAVIGNIDKDSDTKRITLAKDYYHIVQGSTVIMLVETPDILVYNHNYLGFNPDIIIQLGKVVKTRTRI